MRGAFASILLPTSALILVACLVPKFDTGDDSTATAATTDAGTTAADAGYVGGGCGVETTTGQQLCVATSQCPTLVVDTQAMPHCGFRLRSGVADLVCACGTSICTMGTFDTCEQASNLLLNQSESEVCVQVAEGRCYDTATTTTTKTAAPATSSSSSTSSGGTGCDAQCVKDCGGGEACASVCNCN